jgi:hypothetical protein
MRLIYALVLGLAIQTSDANRLPVPEPAAIESAKAKIHDVLGGDFKGAKTSEQKSRLAERLTTCANDPKESPEARFAFFLEARDLYVESGDMLAAFRTIDALAATYQRSAFTEKIDLVQRVSKQAKSTAHHRSISVVALKLAGDALAAEDYSAAKECCQTAVTAARSAADPQLQKRTIDQLRRIEELEVHYLGSVEAAMLLQSNPADADANLKLGRFRCLIRRDWPAGLARLQASSDTELAALAKRDLANPLMASDQIALADGWIQVAEQTKAQVEKASAADRAAYWYEKAVGQLSGIDRLAAEKKLEAAYELSCGRNFTKLRSRAPNGVDFDATADCKTAIHHLKLKGAFDLRKSWLLSFEFMPPNLDGGWHQVFFWGDGRAGRDPLFLRLDGATLWAACDDSVQGRGQAVAAQVPASVIGQWVKVEFVHDVLEGEMQLYLNRRLVARDTMAIVPSPDRKMPLVLGGTDGGEQRFVGQVRKVWLGNIP